ncbi:unnamed protein product [Protopolystoma xenopodis]|uniref:Uncharacterized protein n=1 Tax=Protopolystoma xenopodis TaxID=117903 RepID=A0A3S5B2N8_9PLAT|nr:unnamed protein product [Protopolystoma xenopodis]
MFSAAGLGGFSQNASPTQMIAPTQLLPPTNATITPTSMYTATSSSSHQPVTSMSKSRVLYQSAAVGETPQLSNTSSSTSISRQPTISSVSSVGSYGGAYPVRFSAPAHSQHNLAASSQVQGCPSNVLQNSTSSSQLTGNMDCYNRVSQSQSIAHQPAQSVSAVDAQSSLLDRILHHSSSPAQLQQAIQAQLLAHSGQPPQFHQLIDSILRNVYTVQLSNQASTALSASNAPSSVASTSIGKQSPAVNTTSKNVFLHYLGQIDAPVTTASQFAGSGNVVCQPSTPILLGCSSGIPKLTAATVVAAGAAFASQRNTSSTSSAHRHQAAHQSHPHHQHHTQQPHHQHHIQANHQQQTVSSVGRTCLPAGSSANIPSTYSMLSHATGASLTSASLTSAAATTSVITTTPTTGIAARTRSSQARSGGASLASERNGISSAGAGGSSGALFQVPLLSKLPVLDPKSIDTEAFLHWAINNIL